MAGKTEVVRLKGKVKWAKTSTPDEYKGDKAWTINFYPDGESFATFQGLKLSNKINEDEDGHWVRLKRPVQKRTRSGDVMNFGPIPVVDEDNRVVSAPLGDGTEVTVDLLVYSSPMGKGSRIEKLTVNRLVPMTGTLKPGPSKFDVETTSEIPF